MGNIRFIVLLAVLIVSANASAEEVSKHHIVFFKDYKSLPADELKPWLGYSMILGKCINENGATYERYPLDCEVESRQAVLKLLAADNLPQYYAELSKVQAKGYLAEYSYDFHFQDHWAAPDDVKLEAFRNWSASNLKGHEPKTHLLGVMSNHLQGEAHGGS